MIDRLNRILSLSKKTGDTVIIHDPTEVHDLVVLPFDQYEELRSSDRLCRGEYDEYLLEEMSERELIDKINRDIAIWRSYQELNLREKQAALLEDQLAEEPLPDPFEEDFTHRSDWHRISDLISDPRNKSRVAERSLPEDTETGDPIHTYVPVEEPATVPDTHFPASTFPLPTTPIEPSSAPIFEEETGLEGDDDVVFFEEPSS